MPEVYAKPKKITDKKDLEYLLNLSLRELESFSFMMNNFGVIKGKRRFNTFDIIDIPPGYYGVGKKKNKNTFTTTVGRWVFNKCFIEPELFEILGYINRPIDKNELERINDEISYAVLEDRIPLKALKNYLMHQQKFQPYSNILCSGFTTKMLTMSDTLKPIKEKLFKKYAKELANEDTKIIAIEKIEKELLEYSKKYLKNDPSMDMYNSGAKGKFGNNFKNLFVMKGASKDPDPTKGYNIIGSNLMDGIKPNDYVNMAKTLTEGAYSRGKKTQLGGYWEKLFLRAFQHLSLAPKGTDCGTSRTITITLNKDNIGLVMYSYIVEDNGNIVELTSQNRDKYMGKTVKMRFASLCEWHEEGKICHICAGNFFFRAGFIDVGVATPQLSSKLKNISMKAFHDSTVKLHEIDVMKAFGMKG